MQLMLQKHTGTGAENTTLPHLQALSEHFTAKSQLELVLERAKTRIRDLPNSLPAQRVGSQHPGHLLGIFELSISSALICSIPVLFSIVSVLMKTCILNPFTCLNWISELIDIKQYFQWHN